MGPGPKRKRGDRTYSQDDGAGRPSPHRPGDLNLAHQNYYGHQASHQSQNSYYAHQGSRGGRGGRGRGLPHFSPGRGGLGPQREPQREPDRLEDSSANNHHFAGTTANLLRPRAKSPSVPTASPSNAHNAAFTPQPAVPLPQNPRQPATPVAYDFLTEDRLSDWAGSGRRLTTEDIVKALQTGEEEAVSNAFQELLQAGLEGKLEAQDVGDLIHEVLDRLSDETRGAAESLFVDVVSVLPDQDTAEPRMGTLVSASCVSPSLLRERLEGTVLQALSLTRSNFQQMFIRKQTNILYRQSNYNLLREETEGYSKLMTELFTTTNNDVPSAEVVETTFENVKSLIGAFDLDAGRVLDVTLDVFASLLVKHFRFFVKLLRISSWWPHDSQLTGVSTAEQAFAGLPLWADPEHDDWLASSEERERAGGLQEQRDRQFWQRASEIGINAYFELGARRIMTDHDVDEKLQDDNGSDARSVATREWIKTTRTMPPPGNPVAAQLLGFKLRFYASQARSPTDSLPNHLIYLAALLIKIGFISLRDLYPHLWPPDDDMESVKEKQMKEKEQRELAKRPGGGALNALARAGALVDDTVPPAVSRLREAEGRAGSPSRSERTQSAAAATSSPTPKEAAEEKDQLPEAPDQKVQLLRSLLLMGALPEALYMLGRFPWLLDAFPDMPEHINRILHHSLSKVYAPLCPLQHRDGVREAAKLPSMVQSSAVKGKLALQDQPVQKVLKWAQIDRDDVSEGIDYRFYWEDWSDTIPVCQTVDDVFTLCNTLLNIVGVKIGQDISLFMKIARIGKKSLAADSSDRNKERWKDLCKRLLVPALSLTKANPGTVNEFYDLLKIYPTKTRYNMYSEWFTGQTSRLPDIKDAFELAKAEARDTLKRISKTNTKPMARTLAKLSCASPGVVFAIILNQLESYPNLIDVVVECGRYFTLMGYDILTWALLNTMGKAGRNRVSDDGVTTSKWLTSLSVFTGRIFKRYSTMNPLPVLQYLAEQLQQNNTADMKVLREMITSMAGVAPDTDFNDAQVQAMAGGDLLQSLTIRQLHDRRHESRISAKRLIKILIDSNLAAALLVAIAQQRQLSAMQPQDDSLKVISETFDEIHIGMTQYLDTLLTNMNIGDFDDAMPNLAALVADFGIDPSIAFTIHRNSISQAVERYNISHKVENTKKSNSHKLLEAKEDASMTETLVTTDDTEPSTTEFNEDLESHNVKPAIEDIPMEDASSKEALALELATEKRSPWHPILTDLIDEIRPAFPESSAVSKALPFFVTFWQLSLHDIMAPTSSYNDEVKRQTDRITAINADRSDTTSSGVKRKDQEKKTINEILERLKDEMKEHIQSYGQVRSRLSKEKDHWFSAFGGSQWRQLNSMLLQDCLLPRLLISPLDSYFTFKFLFLLHGYGAPHFSTMQLIDGLFSINTLTNLMFQCTGRESEHLGRFLYELLKELSSWHADRNTYEKKAFGPKKDLPGFARWASEAKAGGLLDYEDFRSLLVKWHRYLTEAIVNCLGTGEYVHERNAINVLKGVHSVFPAINWMGKKICDALQVLVDTEREQRGRQDLWVMSNAVMSQVKQHQKSWVLPQAFHNVTDGSPVTLPLANDKQNSATKPQKTTGQPSSSTSKSPQPVHRVDGTTDAPTLLSAPALDKSAENEAAMAGHRNGEVEDGELEDGETQKRPSSGSGDGSQFPKTARGLKQEQTPKSSVASTPSAIPMLSNDTQRGTTDNSQSSSTSIPTRSQIRGTPVSEMSNTQRFEPVSVSTPNTPPRPGHALPARPDGEGSGRSRQIDRTLGISTNSSAPRSTNREHRTDRSSTDLMQDRLGTRSSSTFVPAGDTGRLDRDQGSLERRRETRGFPSETLQRSTFPHAHVNGLSPRETDRHERSQREVEPSRLHDERAGRAYPESRQTSVHASEVLPVNPAGVATLQQGDGYGTSRNFHDRQDLHSNRNSRPQSPMRSETHSTAQGPALVSDQRRRQDPRDRTPLPFDNRVDPRTHTGDFTPSGPRNNRVSRASYGDNEQAYTSEFMQPPLRSQERGRFESEGYRPGIQQDPSYGRLNADPDSHGGLSGTQPGTQSGRQLHGRTVQTTGSDRGPSGGAAPFPPTNSDRSNNASRPSSAGPDKSSERSGVDISGVHPSRLRHIDTSSEQPSPTQANFLPQHQAYGNQGSAAPPSGPRGMAPYDTSTGLSGAGLPSPSTRNTPNGPSDRRAGVRQFAGLQQTLQQGGQNNINGERGTSIRGRASAQTMNTQQAPYARLNMPPNDIDGGQTQGENLAYGERRVHPSSQAVAGGRLPDSDLMRDKRIGIRRDEPDMARSSDDARHRSSREARDDHSMDMDYQNRAPRIADDAIDGGGFRRTRDSEVGHNYRERDRREPPPRTEYPARTDYAPRTEYTPTRAEYPPRRLGGSISNDLTPTTAWNKDTQESRSDGRWDERRDAAGADGERDAKKRGWPGEDASFDAKRPRRSGA